MLNRKIPVKVVKVKLLKDVRQFSLWQLILFILIFAAIGGYAIYRGTALICACGGGVGAPSGLVADSVGNGEVDLSWTASGSSGVVGYKIYRNNTFIGTTDSSPEYSAAQYLEDNGYTDTTGNYTNSDGYGGNYDDGSLSPATSYSYYVAAYDSYGNISVPSNAITVRTLGTGPTAPQLSALPITASQIDLSWTSSDSANGINYYKIYRNNSLIATTDTTSYSDIGLISSTSYSYYVVAYDTLGNASGPSNAAGTITSRASPTAPANLTAQSVSTSQINLSWGASTSLYPISSYKIYENIIPASDPGDDDAGVPPVYIGSSTSPSYQVTGLQPNTGYSFYVVATDSHSYTSGRSNETKADTIVSTTTCNSSTVINSATTDGSVICPSGLLSTTTTARPKCAPANTAWPYCSPLGDQSCQKVVGGPVYNNCNCNPVISSCTGSCLTSTVNTTDGCRPMTTTQPNSCIGSGIGHSYYAGGIDQGVDFGVTVGCKYYNPNPDDTGAHTWISKANSRLYAMGNGHIVCMAADKSKVFHENLSLTKNCPDGSKIAEGVGTWLVYQLDGGPAGGANNSPKLDIYIAEGCTLANNAIKNVLTGETETHRWQVGESVTANSVLCEISPGTIETGWADNGTLSHLAATSMWTHLKVGLSSGAANLKKTLPYGPVYVSTPWGHSFNEFVEKSGGPNTPIRDLFNGRSMRGKNVWINGHGPVKCPKYFGLRKYPMPAKYKNPAWFRVGAS